MHPWFARNIVYRIIETLREENVSGKLHQVKHIPSLSNDEIISLQNKKLKKTIVSAYNNIPFYNKRMQECGIDIAKLTIPDDIQKIPTLNKKELQKEYKNLINPNINSKTGTERTSGSTGTPLEVIKDREKSGYIRAVMFRCYNQYGITIGDKQGRFWGEPTNVRGKFIENLKDFLANRIRLSAFAVSDEHFKIHINRIMRFKPKYFYGYPSFIYAFSEWMLKNKIKLDSLKMNAIIVTGEILYGFQKEKIEEAFSCKVVNEYGSTEVGVIAFECPKGRMHVNADHVYVESISEQNGNSNQIIVTELNNPYNPLIRYKIGDIGNISKLDCECGLGFPVLEELYGRDKSFIMTPSGRSVYDGILAYTFKEGIENFQCVQEKIDEIIIKIVPKSDLGENLLQNYKQKLSAHLGKEMKIIFEIVDKIERNKNGKLAYFISKI